MGVLGDHPWLVTGIVQCSNAAAQRWYNVSDPAYGYVAVNFQNPGSFDISSLGRFR